MAKRYPTRNSAYRFLAAVLGCCLFFTGCQRNVDYQHIRVEKVYDGDTIRVAGGERIRLIGIDCNEIYDNDKLLRDVRRTGIPAETLKARGQRSFAFTRELLAGRYVRLTFDIERRDKYGRLLAYVWVRARPEDLDRPDYYIEDVHVAEEGYVPHIFVNASLLKTGLAEPMNIRPNTAFAGLFRSLYESSRSSGRASPVP